MTNNMSNIKKEVLARILNVLLRGISMALRLVLILVLAKLLPPADLGVFGLMIATVSFGALILGADFFAYSQREMLARPAEGRWFVIAHQVRAYLILYLMLLPLYLLIFIFDLLDWKYVVWFFVLLILEHISQEINRLLIVMHKQIEASLIIFLRIGSWVIILIPLMYLNEQFRSLNYIYFLWTLGLLLAVIVGGFIVLRSIPIRNKIIIDNKWLKKGFKVGIFFLVATISFQGILTFDRYAVEYFSNLELLGVYVFYASIVIGAYSLLDPAVISFLYPRMLESYQKGDLISYKKTFKELIYSTLFVSIALGLIIWLLTPFLITWVDRTIYTEYLNGLYLLIVAGFFISIGYIPHYALYSMKKDKVIIASQVASVIVFFISLNLIKLDNGIETVSFAVLASFSSMFFLKMISLIFYNRVILSKNKGV